MNDNMGGDDIETGKHAVTNSEEINRNTNYRRRIETTACTEKVSHLDSINTASKSIESNIEDDNSFSENLSNTDVAKHRDFHKNVEESQIGNTVNEEKPLADTTSGVRSMHDRPRRVFSLTEANLLGITKGYEFDNESFVSECSISFLPRSEKGDNDVKIGRPALTRAGSSVLDPEELATAWDIFDKEFQDAMRDREISLFARLKSFRQSCFVTLIIFICHVALSCLYFCVWKDDWTFRGKCLK